MQEARWSIVIPVKTLIRAKTRLAGAAGAHREDLAVAVAADTASAALACPLVARVIVVTADPIPATRLALLGAVVVPDPDKGLNTALRAGFTESVRLAPRDPVAALQADLPALRPAELARALTAAAEFDESFVPDAPGVGTTLYATGPGIPFRPRFGGESRARHLSCGAKELLLDGIDSVRRDVDTVEDLRAAAALGLGPHTAAVAARFLVG
ncbi:2-phospho-L-lactate guanylyltransferase [Acrocarpospora macrocephala]|uniref:Phosphoenolpyruvate guanylyltransferase n=1 Tax=Acrocarpospora macrocephala TaxID=150177 RepID=A0A5M3WPP3_9ACTN|nr:2-phospho-L-lactate guanylyltransferase [Acrocarpospora macrocephala]GES10914.1 2-phospho-L-lactate guanylyltransferase [Acrocarpospora macrocephala]